MVWDGVLEVGEGGGEDLRKLLDGKGLAGQNLATCGGKRSETHTSRLATRLKP